MDAYSDLNWWDESKTYWLAWAMWRVCTTNNWDAEWTSLSSFEWDPVWRSACVSFEEYDDYDPEDTANKSSQEAEIKKMYNRDDIYLYIVNSSNDQWIVWYHNESDLLYKIWLMRWLDDKAYSFLQSQNLINSFKSLTENKKTIWDEDYNVSGWTYLTWDEFTCWTEWECSAKEEVFELWNADFPITIK